MNEGSLTKDLEPKPEIGAGLLIMDNKSRILLVSHTSTTGEVWGLPAGRVEKGEDPRTAAAREGKEELGTEVNITDPIAAVYSSVTSSGVAYLSYVYWAEVTGEIITPSKEIAAARYFSLSEIMNLERKKHIYAISFNRRIFSDLRSGNLVRPPLMSE